MRAILFGDVAGFSQLTEEQMPTFFAHYFRAVEEALRATRSSPDFKATWGDGLFLISSSVVACVEFALSFQERLQGTDWSRLGLPIRGLWIGLHAGAVFSLHDPIGGQTSFFGRQVDRTARIVPVTARTLQTL